MTDDQDNAIYELAELNRKNQTVTNSAIAEIDAHLRYGISIAKFLGWIIIALLALILWRVW